MNKIIVSVKYFKQACEKFKVGLDLATGNRFLTEDGQTLEYHEKTEEIAKKMGVGLMLGETHELPNSDYLFE